MSLQRLIFWISCVTLACTSAFVGAQTFPNKPIKLVIPATTGTSDVIARALAPRLASVLGQSVVVEQMPGAGTNIGNNFVAKSAPDGYTLLINGLPLVTNLALYSQLPYNPVTDLVPVIGLAEVNNVITVHPSLGVQSLKELVQLAKSKPGQLNYGSPGAGSSGHLSAEMLGFKTGAQMVHFPYKGNSQATMDLLRGELQVGFMNLPMALPQVKAGKLKALAVTGAKRSNLLPDVPTVAEALGMPDFELTAWFVIMAPAKTPAPVINLLNKEIDKILKDPDFVQKIHNAGAEVIGGSAASFETRMKKDTVRLSELIKLAGTKAEP
ncbi:MAG: tripartite tricarboxylate transporter substrate binding protein [Burkholderiaceae bacterium]|jgi:tripartite-type tricarboxylate transporter receptor subunit TctC|nr:tripartite tricarboxylate transporter substrate binding protein [Burkholderiaceae bacterium]